MISAGSQRNPLPLNLPRLVLILSSPRAPLPFLVQPTPLLVQTLPLLVQPPVLLVQPPPLPSSSFPAPCSSCCPIFLLLLFGVAPFLAPLHPFMIDFLGCVEIQGLNVWIRGCNLCGRITKVFQLPLPFFLNWCDHRTRKFCMQPT